MGEYSIYKQQQCPMSVKQLIRETFIGDRLNDHGRHSVRGRAIEFYRFSPQTAKLFGWQILKLDRREFKRDGQKVIEILGCGVVHSDELKGILADAGFADCFVFSAEAERRKRPTQNYTDPVFDPETAKLDLRMGIRNSDVVMDWNKLNNEVSNFTLMAKLGVPDPAMA